MKTPTIARYTYSFAAFNLILTILIIISIIVVLGWRSLLSQPIQNDSSIYTRIAINPELVNSGFIFIISGVVSVVFSIWPLMTSPTRSNTATKPLAVYLLIHFITILVTLTIGTMVWFSTLRERSLVFTVWDEDLPVSSKRFIQNDLRCCGWFNATSSGLFNVSELATGFCSNPEALVPNVDPNVLIGCVDKVAAKVDVILNTTFTSLYGFSGVEFALFLVGACLANLRIQQKRFLRIDEKLRLNGKGGFV